MKKILTLLTIFVSIFVIDVNALEYYTINVTSSFEENIEFSEVPLIKLFFYSEGSNLEDDGGIIKSIIELNENNNYSAVLNEMYVNDQTSVFAMVDKDNLGKYNCELNFIPLNDGIAQINIVVTRNVFVSQNIEIPKSVLESIYGKTTNTTIINQNPSNESNNENEVVIGNNTTSNNQQNEIIIKDNAKKEQQKRKKEENIKKNNKISIALFIIIGIIVLLGIIFVGIKFVNANK